MKKLFVAAMMLGVSSAAACAADMIPPPAYDWTGLYAGVNLGYGFAGSDEIGMNGVANLGKLEINGVLGGVQLGYNQQMNNIVFGVETDIQGSGMNDEVSGLAKDNLDWFGTLRGRVGFAADRALFYTTGGLAYGGGTYKDLFNGVSDSYDRAGWTLGAGVEYAVSDNMTIRAEYMYANFGKFHVGGTEATPDFNAVRVGVNFKF
jgi:outer membrane immunogenic protein